MTTKKSDDATQSKIFYYLQSSEKTQNTLSNIKIWPRNGLESYSVQAFTHKHLKGTFYLQWPTCILVDQLTTSVVIVKDLDSCLEVKKWTKLFQKTYKSGTNIITQKKEGILWYELWRQVSFSAEQLHCYKKLNEVMVTQGLAACNWAQYFCEKQYLVNSTTQKHIMHVMIVFWTTDALT